MNDIGLYDTLWAVIIIHTAFGIPICTLVSASNFFQVSAQRPARSGADRRRERVQHLLFASCCR